MLYRQVTATHNVANPCSPYNLQYFVPRVHPGKPTGVAFPQCILVRNSAHLYCVSSLLPQSFLGSSWNWTALHLDPEKSSQASYSEQATPAHLGPPPHPQTKDHIVNPYTNLASNIQPPLLGHKLMVERFARGWPLRRVRLHQPKAVFLGILQHKCPVIVGEFGPSLYCFHHISFFFRWHQPYTISLQFSILPYCFHSIFFCCMASAIHHISPIQNLWEQELAAQHSVCEDSSAEHVEFGVAYLGVPTPPPPCPNTGQVHEKCGNTGSACLDKAVFGQGGGGGG